MKKYLLIISIITRAFSSSAQQGWWTWMHGGGAQNYGTQGVASPTNQPFGAYKTDACWTDSQGNFWVYGNETGSSALWKYNPTTNLWTWMKGPNTNNNNPVFGTKGVAAIANNPPPVSIGGALTWIDANDNLWLFGGNLTKYADLWKYDPTTNMWTWMHGPGIINPPGIYGTKGVPSTANYPKPRYETNASWVDSNGNFWMFGGGANGQLNDMWMYNTSTNQWTWMHGPNTSGDTLGNYGVKGVAAASNIPPCRWTYCRWTDDNGKFWLFGGSGVKNNTDSYNDMWRFDPAINQWTWVSGSNTTNDTSSHPAKCVASSNVYPWGRYENSTAWKDKCGNFWMFSGYQTAAQDSSLKNKSDVWCYKPLTNEWVFVGGNVKPYDGTKGVAAAANFPGDVYGAGSFTYNNEFYFFGGRSSIQGSFHFNKLWKFIPDSACAQSFCFPQSTLPTANYNASNLYGCEPLTVNFTNTSTNATIWSWDFGDGSPISNVQHPTHLYLNSGNYTVTLIVSNGSNSDTLTYINYVKVTPYAVASFTASDDTVCVGTTVLFTNNSTNWSAYFWNISQNNQTLFNDTSFNSSYTFNSIGNYSVTLYINNVANCNDTATKIIVVVNKTPISVSQVGNLLLASPPGSAYQWIDCNTGLPIPGATSASYTPSNNSFTSVAVNVGGCYDTSLCYYYGYTPVKVIDTKGLIEIVPNPNKGEFTMSGLQQGMYLQIYDVVGRIIYETKVTSRELKINLSEKEKGIYFYRIRNEKLEMVTGKIIVK